LNLGPYAVSGGLGTEGVIYDSASFVAEGSPYLYLYLFNKDIQYETTSAVLNIQVSPLCFMECSGNRSTPNHNGPYRPNIASTTPNKVPSTPGSRPLQNPGNTPSQQQLDFFQQQINDVRRQIYDLETRITELQSSS
jgi:hypothetical protein